MKLALVSSQLTPYTIGGMGRFTRFLAAHLVKAGSEVTVLYPTPPGPAMPVGENFYLVPIPVTAAGPQFARYISFLYRASLFVSRGNFNAVYWVGGQVGYNLGPDFPASLANPLGLEGFKRPLSVRLRNLLYHTHLRLAISRTQRVISFGGQLTDEIVRYLKVDRTRITEIPNGVDLGFLEEQAAQAPPLPWRFRRRSLLFVGRLASNKGLADLLEAFTQLRRQSDVDLLIAGEGPERTRLQRQVTDLSVKFLGFVPDPLLFKLYHAATAFVFPSRNEGMPTVILEAMAAGLPIIATDVGAIGTMVSERNGRLVPPADPRALLNAIESLLELPTAHLRELGTASRRIVEEQFTWDRVAARTLETCQEVLG